MQTPYLVRGIASLLSVANALAAKTIASGQCAKQYRCEATSAVEQDDHSRSK